MADKKAVENFAQEVMNKRKYDVDYEKFATMDNPDANPLTQSFTTLPAIASLRIHNHPKTKANWLKG